MRLIPALLLLALCGCSAQPEEEAPAAAPVQASYRELDQFGAYHVGVWADPETGCEYLVGDGANRLTLTPRNAQHARGAIRQQGCRPGDLP